MMGKIPHHIEHLLKDEQAKHNPVYNVDKDHLGLIGLSKHHNTTSHNALVGGGVLNHKQAHSDLKTIAGVHGFTGISHNPFEDK
jgi:hypothetical protein